MKKKKKNGTETHTVNHVPTQMLTALKRGGYKVEKAYLGERPGGAKAAAYPVAVKDEERIALSIKTQESSGSAEQKVPFEVMSLMKFLKEKTCTKAVLVCRGAGWSMMEWLVGGGLRDFIKYPDELKIISEDDFLKFSKQGLL